MSEKEGALTMNVCEDRPATIPHTSTKIRGIAFFLRDECGQDMIEYCLILSAIGLGAFALCNNIGTVISNGLSGIGNSITATV